MNSRKMLTRFLMVLPILSLGILLSAPQAKAGYFNDVYNGIKTFSEIPSDMNQLKQEYQDAAKQLSEAQSTLEAYQNQNEELVKQNQELTETVKTLNAAQEAREASSRRLRIILYTVIGLFVGYFIFMRVLRVLLRR
ncbi:hypothetical protein [Paenibacillus sp. CAA11]|uniref:hypothetical protein n=1 Tax=Paenibacillus sp. CAA11 TaxID=1532905 RepID=UPI001F16C29A|nr:hypothetical protein [Paenibacillus sp. CAA11]